MTNTLECIAREMYEELFHSGNPRVLDKYVDADFVYQNPMKPVKGRDQIVDLVNAQRRSFRDYSLTVDRVAGNAEYVAVAWTIRGVHEKDFYNFPPSGRSVTFSGITMHRFKNGRSVEAWSYSNMQEALTA